MNIVNVSDEQIKKLFDFILGEYRNIKIERFESDEVITVSLETQWNDEDGGFWVEDSFGLSNTDILSDFPLDRSDCFVYKQWLVANKVHPHFNNNPFIDN